LTLSDNEIEDIYNREYNETLINLFKEKYFIYSNLDRYLTYYSDHDIDLSMVVSLVNVNRDNEYYTNVKNSIAEYGKLMLVNKYNFLDEDYVPESLQKISSTYAYADNYATEETIEAFKNMYNEALKEDIKLIVNSSYRSYSDQYDVWSYRKNLYGTEKADSYAARAGYSEHQTGLALDINQFNYSGENFEDAPAFIWLENNAYKYGFILRYPEGKENITGYSYESWHYRYIGVDAAKICYEEDLTYDEYYAYYIENSG
jgi:LAS superfamily LD-carboxypeptidase LdcB